MRIQNNLPIRTGKQKTTFGQFKSMSEYNAWKAIQDSKHWLEERASKLLELADLRKKYKALQATMSGQNSRTPGFWENKVEADNLFAKIGEIRGLYDSNI